MKKIFVFLLSITILISSVYAEDLISDYSADSSDFVSDIFDNKNALGFKIGFPDFGLEYARWFNEKNGFAVSLGAIGESLVSMFSVDASYYHAFLVNASQTKDNSLVLGTKAYFYADAGCLLGDVIFSVQKFAPYAGAGIGIELFPNKIFSVYVETGIEFHYTFGDENKFVWDEEPSDENPEGVYHYEPIFVTSLTSLTLPSVGIRIRF